MRDSSDCSAGSSINELGKSISDYKGDTLEILPFAKDQSILNLAIQRESYTIKQFDSEDISSASSANLTEDADEMNNHKIPS